jgi:hypothetical protein
MIWSRCIEKRDWVNTIRAGTQFDVLEEADFALDFSSADTAAARRYRTSAIVSFLPEAGLSASPLGKPVWSKTILNPEPCFTSSNLAIE